MRLETRVHSARWSRVTSVHSGQFSPGVLPADRISRSLADVRKVSARQLGQRTSRACRALEQRKQRRWGFTDQTNKASQPPLVKTRIDRLNSSFNTKLLICEAHSTRTGCTGTSENAPETAQDALAVQIHKRVCIGSQQRTACWKRCQGSEFHGSWTQNQGRAKR